MRTFKLLFIIMLSLSYLGLDAQESSASYKVTFDAAWSRTTHPYQFPFDARWSPPVGLTHDTSVSLFETGAVASQGIVNMSQTGSRDPLNDEIDAIISTGGGEFRVNSPIRVNPSPDTISFTFDISESHPYLSLTSMIAPSPDWFVGFRNLNLFENGAWVESTIVQFSPYDSGSDSGTTFASPNEDTQPREGIAPITDGPLFATGEASLGFWRIERIDTESTCDVSGGSLVGGPFEFCVDGTPDNLSDDDITLTGANGASQWIVTDDRGYILGLPPSFTGPDFDAAGVGLCFIYHMSYEGALTGLEVGNNIADIVGCFNLSNSTYVDRQDDAETCNPNETASYRIIFDATWSGVTHPVDFPADEPNIARWSPVAGITHNAETSLFVDGAQASQGIVNISQTGSRDPLNDELDRFIIDGGAEFRVNSTTRVRPSPDTISFNFDITSSHPRVSLVSMIAPSPDWIVALRDLQLFNDGAWTESQIVQFKSYDSGSDSGTTFASPDQDTQPREGITPITDGPIFANGNQASLGLWRIERIDAESTCDVFGGELVGGPFEFTVDGTPDNIAENAISVTGATGPNNQWVVTDDSGNILGLPPSFTAPDFDAAGVGVCFIYHLSYEDGLTGLAQGSNIDDLDGCFNLSNSTYVNRTDANSTATPVGAVYAMTNGNGQIDGNVQGPNSVIAYGQAEDGTLSIIGEYTTGGNGGDYDGGEGLDPLISAYAITKTVDNRFVLAVNAGSNTVTSMRVNDDFSLSVIDTESTEDIGPNSIAHKPSAMDGVNGLVYVSNITRPEFLALGEPAQQGSVIGFRLMDDGSLEPVANSQRDLANRPSAVQFSPNGEFLVVASINAGASALASGSEDEIVVYSVNADGTLSANQTAGATSTLRDNTEGRNLPSAIGFQIVGDNYVVVTEAREFQPNGLPPAFPALQDGSVSTWQIQADGSLTPIDLDVASGENNTGRTACWLDFSDENTFFVSNAIEAGLASYSFNNGNIELLNQVAAQGTGATGNTTDPAAAFGTTEGWIDMWISDDGQYLYQCYGLTGEVGVFAIDGAELTLLQEIGGLPQNNVQGIVSVGQPMDDDVVDATPPVGAVYAMTNGEGQIDGNVQGPNAVVAYAQAEDGTLTLMGEFPTGGNGGDYDGGEGLDPLISAYAITKSNDNKFVMAVNAGSNTVTSMRVNDDFTLTVVDTETTQDVGPNSIAYVPSRRLGVNGIVYVSNITREEFLALGEPAQQGSIVGYQLMNDGNLVPIEGSRRELANRPSAVQISPDGDFLVVASINAGAAALASGSEDEVVVYGLDANGVVTDTQLAGATSTLRGNAEGRNLPSAIGFQIVGDNYLVVTEAREFQSDGAPPAFPALQDGSVSTWQIANDGSLIPINLDVASGENNTGRTACWLDFSDENTFFVSNAIEAGLASYSFDNGNIELLNQVAAQGTGATGNTTDPAAAFGTTEGWIDLWISDDGQYLYQCYGLTGEVGVFAINGAELTLIQEIGGLPQNNVQGIVSVGQQPDASENTAQYRVTFDALWSQTSHPNDFPAEEPNIARWSPVAGLTHNNSVRLFNDGDIASEGLVNISQTGSRDPLDAELAGVILSGAGEFYIESDTRVRPSPDTISTTFMISSSHQYVSLTSMIAPSPDWIVAARDINLFENGEFVESKIVQFTPYDTGSDSGTTFASENEDTQPREGISQITDGILATNGRIPSLGIWRFERIDNGSTCNVEGGTLEGGPFTFTVDGTPDNIPANALTLTDNTGANSQWVVTDDKGYILGLPPTFSAPDFDAAGSGLCYVYHLSYEDGLRGLDVGNNIAGLVGCFDLSNEVYVKRDQDADVPGVPVGAVYAMTNGEGQVDGNVQGPNAVIAYGQAEDGTLTLIGEFPTGGNGGDYDGGEGLDPLISAYAITKTVDNRFVLAVNAGSNTVTSMRVNDDFTLTVMDTESTEDIGPNSIAHKPSTMDGVNGLVYVSNITRPEFLALGEPAQQGSIIGFRLMDDGSLEPVANSQRDLANRPSAVQFSPNGEFLVVASINAGASALASGSQDEIVVYSVNADGTLSANQTAGATSTLRDNTEGRNLPSAIGFQIVDDNYVVVTEAREFQPDGLPPAFPALQDGSVSTWQIQADGSLTPIDLDVASGTNNTGRTACWLDFSDENTFFVSNAIEAGLASYSFDNGNIELLDQVAAQGTGATGNTTDPAAAFGTTEGWIDMWISDDGRYLYQCYGLTGTVGVFEINGTELTLLQEVSGDLPMNNVQGIVAVGPIQNVNTGGDNVVDLNINISVDNSLYNNFEEVAYTITVANEGTEEATNVVVSAGLPEGMVFTSADTDNGDYELFFEEWTINSLAAGEIATLELTLFTLIEGVDITNEVGIIGLDQVDANLDNNFAEVTITPFENGGVGNGDGNIDLELSIEASSTTFERFEDVDFTITLSNTGTDMATDLFVNAPVPEGMAFTDSDVTRGTYNLFFERWKLDDLAPGESATLTLTLFTLIDDAPITNYVQVLAAHESDVDSTPGNNDGPTPSEDDEAAVTIEHNEDSVVEATVSQFRLGNLGMMTIKSAYPNPARSFTMLPIESEFDINTTLDITDSFGRIVHTREIGIIEGNNIFQIDLDQFAPGIYFVTVKGINGNRVNQRFLKVE